MSRTCPRYAKRAMPSLILPGRLRARPFRWPPWSPPATCSRWRPGPWPTADRDVALRVAGGPGLLVAKAVEEAAEQAAFAGQGGAGRGRNSALAGDGLVVVGAGDGVDDLRFAEVFGTIDLGHVAHQHAVAHDLGFQAGGAVGVPLGFAAAGQGNADAVLAYAAAQQVRVDATVAEGVSDAAGPE